MNKQLLAGLAAAALLMTACGGGDDSSPSSPVVTTPPADPTPVAEVPPDSASQSAEGFTAYLQTLAATPSDSADAVDLSKFLPPKSETAEPTSVN